MDINRRDLQVGLASLAIGSMAGCVNVPDDGNSGDGSSDEDEQDTNETTGDDEQQEETEPADLSDEQLIYNSIDDVFGFSSWLANNMDELREEIILALREADGRLSSLSNDLDDDEITEDYIKETARIIREMQEPADEIAKHFDDVLSYEWFAGEVEETLLDSLRRQEYEDLRSQADEFEDRVSRQQSSDYLIDHFPEHYVSGKPYLTFSNVGYQYDEDDETETVEKINSIEWRNIYELFYRESDLGHPFYVLPGVMNIPYNPLSRGIGKPELVEPSFSDPRSRDSELISDSSWLSVSAGRSGELFMNIHPYKLLDGNYPEDIYLLREKEDLPYRSRLDQPNLNDSEPVRIYIQKFADETSATAAVESIKESCQQDGERTLFGSSGEELEDWEENKISLTFDKLFKVKETEDGSETLYADLLQNKEYVVAFAVEDVQWSTRELLDKRFENEDEYEPIDVGRALYQSWLNIHRPEED